MCEFSGHSFGFWTSASCDHGHEHRGQPVSEHTLNEESTSGMMAEIFWQRAGKNCFTLHANYMLLYSICFPSAAHLLRNCTLHFLAFCLSVASCSKSAIIVADSAACASWPCATACWPFAFSPPALRVQFQCVRAWTIMDAK